jgi:hypothetical protein
MDKFFQVVLHFTELSVAAKTAESAQAFKASRIFCGAVHHEKIYSWSVSLLQSVDAMRQ